MNRFIIISLVAVIGACAQEQKPAAQTETAPPPTTSVAVQEQTVDVSGTFTPASLTIPAGQPVRIHFRRGDKPTCADEIVFPDLGIRKKLPANQTVTVDLPAQQARTLTFVCGMNMLKGTVVVQ